MRDRPGRSGRRLCGVGRRHADGREAAADTAFRLPPGSAAALGARDHAGARNGGDVVWFHPLDTSSVTDFRVQRYRGRPVLTWWRGETADGVGNGRYVISDESHHVVTNVRAGHNLSGDIHEFLITPLFTVYRR